MPFHSLDSDLLLHICMLLDVFTIISISRVNKYLHAIVSAKQLWISVVCDLSARCLIDPPAEENLQKLSTAELMQQVKRGVVGPLTWSSTFPTLPTLSRQISISLETLQGESSHVEFLPEGRHILLYKVTGAFPHGVECWDVRRGQRVWGWASPSHPVGHATFNFRRGGSEAVVLLESYAPRNHLLILLANLETGDSWNLLDLPVDPVCIPRVKMSEDFFLCRVHSPEWPGPVLLVNWRTAEFVLFNSSNLEKTQFELFPGHIAFTYYESSTPAHVRIYSIVSFDHLWRQLSEFTLDGPTDPTEIPHVAVDIPGLDTPSKPIVVFSISESPVHNDSYDLVVRTTARADSARRLSLARRIRNRLTNTPAPPRWSTTISRYRLTLRPLSPAVGPQSKSFFHHQKYFGWFVIRHQYGLPWGVPDRPVVHELTDTGIQRPRALPIPVEAGVPTAAPHWQLSRTGAVMVHLGSRIVVCYYL
ncbi:hypothetical protein FB451DRAFT_1274958 [Mycena latifolia]|nr:hypothetical protein FB451DRAFT_1274958 [Mycena latifolia]